MVIALKSLEYDIEQLQVFECQSFMETLGSDWCIRRIKRTWHETSTFKYIMNNAYISPKFANSRDFKDDVTAIKVKQALKRENSTLNVQVVRLGSLKLQYLPTRLLITTSQKLDEKILHQNYRRINGQRVTWERFNENNKPKKEFNLLSNSEKLAKFKSMKINVGIHKGFEYVDENKDEDEHQINIIADDDYNDLTAFWRTTVNETSLSSVVYNKLSEIYNGNDGSEWSAHLKEQNEDKFTVYAAKLYKNQKDNILNKLDKVDKGKINFISATSLVADTQNINLPSFNNNNNNIINGNDKSMELENNSNDDEDQDMEQSSYVFSKRMSRKRKRDENANC